MTTHAFGSLPLALLLVLTIANVMAAAVSLYAMRRAVQCSLKTATPSAASKRFDELALRVVELSDSHDALFDSHTKLRSRVGMRVNREKKADEQTDDDTGGDWKAKKRRELGAALLTPNIAGRKN